MKTQSWYQSRSEFNHDWLKNRFLIALSKARNVLGGKVEDYSIWEHMANLLAEWRERREDVRRLILEFRGATTSARMLASAGFVNLDGEVIDWLADLAERRWEAAVQPDVRMHHALGAFEVFDLQMEEFVSILEQAPERASFFLTEQKLAAIQTSSHALSESISALRTSWK